MIERIVAIENEIKYLKVSINSLNDWTVEHEKEGATYGNEFENRDDILNKRLDACEQNYPSLWKRIEIVEKALEEYREYRTDIEDLETDVMYLKEAKECILSECHKIDKKVVECLKDFIGRIEKLEEMQRSMLNMPNIIWAKYNKTPHKCPVCNGQGNIYTQYMCNEIDLLSGWKKDALGMAYKDCKSCDSKGILWG